MVLDQSLEGCLVLRSFHPSLNLFHLPTSRFAARKYVFIGSDYSVLVGKENERHVKRELRVRNGDRDGERENTGEFFALAKPLILERKVIVILQHARTFNGFAQTN
jgi:hypothetical protein